MSERHPFRLQDKAVSSCTELGMEGLVLMDGADVLAVTLGQSIEERIKNAPRLYGVQLLKNSIQISIIPP